MLAWIRPNLNKITCVEDMQRVYRRRVPTMFYDYCETGSWSEQTFKENRSDFKKIYLRQRVLHDLSRCNLTVKLWDTALSMPVILAPVGLTGMQCADGEILVAKAAKKFGVPYILSTMSICSIEDVSVATDHHPFWYQLYMMKDRAFMEDLIQRAKRANCGALVLTVDLQMIGQRHKDIKNGLSTPPKITLKNWLEFVYKYPWSRGILHTHRRFFGNIAGYANNVSDISSLSAWTNEQFDKKLNWQDVSWVRKRWDGPLIIKGIMEIDDAKHAVKCGADAIVVSNHGGRQLDGAPSSISVLPEIVKAIREIDNSFPILIDGGIRSGQDILKAIALGAHAALVGRSYIYGLGAFGEKGVQKILSILQDELSCSMAFCGVTEMDKVSRSILRRNPMNELLDSL